MSQQVYDQKTGFRPDWRENYFSGTPMRFGNEVQFLLDDYTVEDRFGLKRVVGPVEKHPGNPLVFNPPTDEGVALRHVLHDPAEERYKAWYCSYRYMPGIETGHNYSTLYVESRDGIAWEQPELGLHPRDEQGRGNLVLHKEDGACCLMEDVRIDPQPGHPGQRFRALVKMTPPGESQRCIVQMVSPDGRKWTLDPDPILFRGASDGSYCPVCDPEHGRWLLFRRPPTRALKGYAADGFYAGANDKRRVSVCMSPDGKSWTYPRTAALPDEIDVSDVDWVMVTRQRGLWIGFISLMDNPAAQPLHAHLMWSRDGFAWERLPDRPRLVENGSPGEWDEGSVRIVSLIPEGDRIRIYYGAANVPQAEKRLPRIRGTGLAWIGIDRFIGQRAGPEGGYLLTRQFIFEGDRLEINCCSQVLCPPSPELGGLIRAELLREPVEHQPAAAYRGFGMNDSDPLAVTDNPCHVMTWRGSPDLSALRGKPVYIRFYIRNATLYSFRVAD